MTKIIVNHENTEYKLPVIEIPNEMSFSLFSVNLDAVSKDLSFEEFTCFHEKVEKALLDKLNSIK